MDGAVSIVGVLRGIFSTPDLMEGALIMDQAAMKAFGALSAHPQVEWEPDFAKAAALSRDSVKWIVDQYHMTDYSYGQDAPDFPLCRDFSEMAVCDVRRGAIMNFLKVRPVFCAADVTLRDGGRHSLNVAFLADGTLGWFEPQNGTWTFDGVPEDVASLDRLDL